MNTNNIEELLVCAAKAANIELDLNAPNDGGYHAKQRGVWTHRWAPHLDDGDSRRLEMALSMKVDIGDTSDPEGVVTASLPTGEKATVRHDGNPEIAVRLAVLYVAAQRGNTGEQSVSGSKDALDYTLIKLDFDHSVNVISESDTDLDHFVQPFRVRISVWSKEDNYPGMREDGYVPIGYLSAQLVLTSQAGENGHSVLDVMDSHSQELLDAYPVLFKEDEFSRRTLKLWDDDFMTPDSVLYLSRLHIDQDHRGHHVGLKAIGGFVHAMYAYNPLVVLQAYPIRTLHDDGEEQPLTQKEIEKAKKKLATYYRKLGFQKLKDDYMIVNGRESNPLCSIFNDEIAIL